MIVLVSLIYSIATKTSCFHYFSHGASLHRHSFSRMTFALVSHKLLHVRSVIHVRARTR